MTPTTLLDVLFDRATRTPDRLALRVLGDGEAVSAELSYAALWRRAGQVATAIAARTQPGDRVLVLHGNDEHYLTGFLGCALAATIAVPAFPPEPSRPQAMARLRGIVRNAQPRLALVSSARPRVELGVAQLASDGALDGETRRAVQADDVAFLQYTSGSTGTPRGVRISHANVLANARAIQRAFATGDDDIVVSWLPLYHDMGLIGGALQSLFIGAPLTLMSPEHFGASPARWLRAIARYGATISGGPDFAYRLCVERVKPYQLEGVSLASWQVAFCGAEPIRAETLTAFADKLAPVGFRAGALYPCYGLAEATLLVTGGVRGGGATIGRFDDAALGHGRAVAVDDGRAVVGCGGIPEGVELLDPDSGAPVAAGQVGEIVVRGASVTAGYWHDEAASAALFVRRPDGVALRTGDLGFVHNGALFVTGRRKDVVIVRGQNLYPQDIEDTVAGLDLARSGRIAAFAVDGGHGEAIGVAMELSKPAQRSVDTADVFRAIREAVAEAHGEPPQVILLLAAGTLPMTSSGKLRRRECLRAWRAGALVPFAVFERAARDGGEAAVDGTLGQLIALVGEVLGAADVRGSDSLFALGISSLTAMELAGRARERGLALDPQDVFGAVTVAALAALVDRRHASAAPRIPVIARDGRLPLSPGEQRLWFLHQLEPRSAAYHLTGALHITGPLDRGVLQAALSAVVARHEALRTRFVADARGPVRVIDAPWQVELASVDGSALADWLAQPFDLAHDRLLRVALVAGEQRLVAALHHIVADSASMDVLRRELAASYAAIAGGTPPVLAPLPIQVADHAAWQAGDLHDSQDGLAYWRTQLAGEREALRLPRSRASRGEPRRDEQHAFALDAALTDRLRRFAQAQSTTLFALLLGGLQITLHRYAAQDDLWIGAPIANRGPQTAGLIGFFVNTCVLRTRVAPRDGFLGHLGRVRETLAGALAHGHVPFQQVIEATGAERDVDQQALFQVFYNHLAPAYAAPLLAGSVTLGAIERTGYSADFDLVLDTAEDAAGISGVFTYRADRIDAAAVDRIARHYAALLDALIAEPARAIDEVRVDDAIDEHVPDDTIGRVPVHEAIARHAAATPDAIAVRLGDHVLRYRELDARADRWATALRAAGVGPESIVGVCAEPSFALVIGVVAALKAGGAFLALDPSYPRDRLATMVRDARPAVILIEDHLALDAPDARVLRFSDEPHAAAPPATVHPAQLAYCIYTSGSTGTPKAALLTHDGLANHLAWMRGAFPAGATDRVLQCAPSGFDAAVCELLLPLVAGGTCVMMPRDDTRDPARLIAQLARHDVTLFITVPSLLALVADADGGLAALQRLRCVGAGGEAMPARLASQLCALPALFNLYGPTEITIDATAWRVTGDDLGGDPPIGRPITNTRAHVLDGALRPVPVGGVGELYIAGAGVARGYLGQPALTADRFIPDPGPGPAGTRLYRTGDLVRRRADGAIEYLARVDRQIKLHGHRIELGEITAQLAEQPEVRQATVELRGDARGKRQLVAYVVSDASHDELRAQLPVRLAAVLPAAMVPRLYVFLDALPVMPSGKLDRHALPAPDLRAARHAYVAPRSAPEHALAAIWQDVLGVPEVGVHDNFFQLGGDSIIAIQVVGKARAAGLAISPRDVFRHQTIEALAMVAAPLAPVEPLVARVGLDRLDAGERARLPVDADDVEDVFPLTPMQEGMRLHTLLEPGSGIYLMQDRYRVDSALEPVAFLAAWDAVVARHPALRASFWQLGDKTLQIIHRTAPRCTEYIDLRGVADADDRIAAVLADERARGFDFATAPLMRLRLFQLAERRFVYVESHHHILMDDWCRSLLFLDFFAAYRALLAGERPALGPAPRHADHVAWLERQDRAAALAHWEAALDGVTAATPLAIDHPAAPGVSRVGDETVELTVDETELLADTARRLRLTVNTLAQGAWAVLLARYAGARDVVFGVTVAGRSAEVPGVQDMVGLFVNTIPLRVRLPAPGAATTIADWLAALQDQNLAHRQYEHVPLVDIQARTRVPRGEELFHSLFVFENAPLDPSLRVHAEELRFRLQDNRTHTNYPLTAVAIPGERLTLVLSYDARRFAAGDVARMVAQLARVLTAIARAPERPVHALSALSDDDVRTLVHDWNATARDHALHRGFAERFDARAAATPDAIAARHRDEVLTYRELAVRAHRVAHGLRRRGVAIGDPVAVLADRGLDQLALIVGVLCAGAVYVALDVRHPDERTQQLIRASGTRVVLATTPREGAITLADCADEPDHALALPCHPDQLAYVVFTSGSTGTPKGAMVTMAGMLNNQLSKVPFLGLSEADVIAQTAAPSFDISVWQLLTGLLCGAIVELVPDDVVGDPRALLAHVRATGITILESVPALIAELLREPDGPLPLRFLLPTGEALPPALARQWLRRYPHIPMINAYGPAECADDVALCRITAPPGDELRMPIGTPTDNTQLFVLDPGLALVPIGVVGQLAVAGVGVGHGYLADPARTAEAFVPHPFGRPGERIYLTGDLARHRPDGVLEYVGRADHQIKLRGHRIELGEIEARLRALDDVRDAAVALCEDRLVAYVVTGDASSIRARLAAVLPEPMVPAHVVVLDALPLTANGKLDRQALPAPELTPAPYTAPRTPLEIQLAQIWADALGVAQVGLDDGFFDLGGHSLLATRVTSRILHDLGVTVPLRAIFEASRLGAFAARVASYAPAARSTIPTVDRDRPLPLSFAQERQWFLWRLAPSSSAYHIPMVARLTGRLDRDALVAAFTALAARHDALRTRFVEHDGHVAQVLGAPPPVIDFAAPRALDAAIAAQIALPFDLARGPSWRVAVYPLGDDAHVLAVVLHHIVADEVSLRILIDEFAALYAGEALPPLAIQYADYAVWQRGWLVGAELDRQLAYWTAHLGDDHAPIELPSDRPRPAIASARGALHELVLDAALTAGLRRLARAHDATLFMVLLAAFDVLLYRLTGQADLRVGVPFANRPRLELERVIGFFLNTHVLRAQLAPRAGFTALLAQVKDTALAAQAHADLPFEQLVEALHPQRSLSHSPLFQVMFNFLWAERDRSAALPGLRLEPYDHARTTTQFDLALDTWEDGDALHGALTYATDLFEAATAARVAASYVQLLRAIVAAPDAPIALLPMLDGDEHRRLNHTLAIGPRGAPDPRGVHDVIAAQIVRTPDAVAVTYRGEDLSYAELGRRAARLAHRLRGLGVGPDALVGVCLERSHHLVPSALAVLQAGGAYLPLDPDYPRDRIAYMLRDARPRVVITEAHLAARFADEVAAAGATLCVLAPDDGAALTITVPGHPAQLAYCIYTSGSTGRPKGALIPHVALRTHLAAMRDQLRLTPADRVLAIAPFSFDIATLELLLPLVTGARVVLADRVEALDPQLLLARVRADGVTVMQGTPATWRMVTGDRSAADTLRDVRMLSGGEAMPPDLAHQLIAIAGGFCNSYGPTETTIYSSSAHLAPAMPDPVIGAPLTDTTYHVLDAHLQPVPVGVAGELYIGGALLARGYRDRAALTAERFVPDPFGRGARLYRSGDVVRRRADGELDFLRRADHQVKLRGHRIELGEIEARLLTDPRVRAAAVALRTEGEPRLVAYVVLADEPIDPATLQAGLRAALPEVMVPTSFVALDALPVTANGKLDRKALPAPDLRDAQASYVPPRTEQEARLAAIWADALGVDRVGLDDDFFELGGHSLLATRVAARILRDLGKSVALRTIFEAPRLADFAARVQAMVATTHAPIAPVDRAAPLPLSFAQERQWFLWQLEPDTRAYHLPIAVTLTGAVDHAALRIAFAQLAARHEALRTRFAVHDGHPIQVIEPHAAPLVIEDVTDAAAAVEHALAEPFDLARGPLWRARLYRVADDHHVLLVVMHHAISDEASLRLLIDELGRRYTGAALAPLAIQYADYAAWQRDQRGELDRQLAYWRDQLGEDHPVIELPFDRPRPAIASARGAARALVLDAALTRGLVRLARAHDATLFMVLLAAFDALLYRITGQRDLRVGVPFANRHRLELEGVIGFFVNTHVLRAQIAPEASFAALLAGVRESALGAQAHPDLPFEQLVEALRPPRSLSHNPLFQVMFNHLWQDLARPIALPGLVLEPLALPHTTAQVELQLTTWEDDGVVRGALTYATDLFDDASIERLAAQYTAVLRAIVAAPDTAIARLPLPAPESAVGVVEPLDPRGLHARIAAQVVRTPDAIAIRHTRDMSYGELGRRAASLATRLRALGVGPDVLVGLCVERSERLVIGALGILMAGGAYVPLDPDYPRDRLAFMLADARPRVLVTEPALADGLADDLTVCVIDDDQAPLHAVAVHPAHLAYCIYTSGSTGRPKGVAISHAAIGNFLDAMLRALPITAADRVLAITPISFDIAGLELFLPLIAGASIVLADRSEALDPTLLLSRIRDAAVTVVQATPSTWRMVVDHPAADVLRSCRLLCGGEALPPDLAAQLAALAPAWNVYGPTETTVWSAIAPIEHARPPVLGAPLRNTTIHVLDAARQPVPLGVAGELYVGGDGLARGYWQRAALTAERFVPCDDGQRLYRTGDRVRRRGDGALEFLGRIDHQIKLRGHRIELGEIDAQLLADDRVHAAAVVLREDRPGEPRLVAYVVTAADPAELQAALRQQLPDYMIPPSFVVLDALPRSPAGKLDRAALPVPDAPVRVPVAPRDDLERRLVALWQDVLGVPALGIHDGFFELGGHSLSATRLASRIREDLAIELPLRVLFEATTVAALADVLRGLGAISDTALDDMASLLDQLETPT